MGIIIIMSGRIRGGKRGVLGILGWKRGLNRGGWGVKHGYELLGFKSVWVGVGVGIVTRLLPLIVWQEWGGKNGGLPFICVQLGYFNFAATVQGSGAGCCTYVPS